MGMTRRRKLTFAAGAGAVALLLAALGAAGAVAASQLFSPGEASKAVIDDAAAQLGVEPEALSDALKQALKNRVDEAVEAGRLTEEQGQRLKERIDSDEYPSLFGRGHLGRGHFGRFGHFGHFGHFGLLGAAASYLGLTEAELREALKSKSLAAIAEEQGKAVSGLVQELVATQTQRIDEAVADGRLTDEQAERLKSGLQERTEALVERARGDRGAKPFRFRPGSGSPRAPPLFGGPSA